MGGIKSDTGEHLRKLHHIPAQQVRFHWKGDFFMPLEKFPGALADKHGYVLFATEKEYASHPSLDHRGSSQNPRVGVVGGVSNLSGYKKFN